MKKRFRVAVEIHDDGSVSVPGNPVAPNMKGLHVCAVQANAASAERLVAMGNVERGGVTVKPDLPDGVFFLCCVTENGEPYVEAWKLPEVQ